MNDRNGTPDTGSTPEVLRAALAARAASVRPSADGLTRIEEKLMSEPTANPTRKWLIGVASVAAIAVLVVIGLVVTDDDDSDVVADTTPTTDAETTTTEATTTTETTTTTTFTSEVDPFSVAYPGPTTSQRFESPESAATSYATDVLGFTELVIGEYREGDSRSGEVPVTDREGNPETTVLVRQMADDTWYVLASVAADITVDEPSAGDDVTAPLATSGTALAFEGTVDVVVRTQDDPEPLGEGFVTGSGVPPAGPFDGTVEFTPPTGDTPGIVIYRTLSAEDGHVLQAASLPVRLLPA